MENQDDTKDKKVKRKSGRPRNQKYQGWKVVVVPVDCPFDEKAFWDAFDKLASYSADPENEDGRENKE